MEYLLHNGKIKPGVEFNPRDEWQNYSFSFRLCMWFAHGEIPYFEAHLNRLSLFLETLERPYNIDHAFRTELMRLCKRLINKNRAYMGGWLTLSVFPGENNWAFIGQVRKHSQREIPFDEQGKLALFSDEYVDPEKPLAFKKPGFEFMSAIEMLRLSGSRYGQAIFTQKNGVVVAAANANLYCILGNRLITPSLKTGCPDDHFRELTIQSAKRLGMKIEETDIMVANDLNKMDEIFLSSECMGFGWILGVGIKRYVKRQVENIRMVAEDLLWENRPN